MAQLDILKYPDPRLKQVSEEVETFDDELMQFLDDLEETMEDGPGAVGIAAPQVGRFQRIAIVDVSGNPKNSSNGRLFLINPEILEWDGMKLGREGCLSVPDYTGNVVRAKRVKLRFQNRDNETVEIDSEGFEARAIQHEMDHLDGMLFVDRVVSRRHDLFQRKNYQKGGQQK